MASTFAAVCGQVYDAEQELWEPWVLKVMQAHGQVGTFGVSDATGQGGSPPDPNLTLYACYAESSALDAVLADDDIVVPWSTNPIAPHQMCPGHELGLLRNFLVAKGLSTAQAKAAVGEKVNARTRWMVAGIEFNPGGNGGNGAWLPSQYGLARWLRENSI